MWTFRFFALPPPLDFSHFYGTFRFWTASLTLIKLDVILPILYSVWSISLQNLTLLPIILLSPIVMCPQLQCRHSCQFTSLLCCLAMWEKAESVQIHATSDCSGMFWLWRVWRHRLSTNQGFGKFERTEWHNLGLFTIRLFFFFYYFLLSIGSYYCDSNQVTDNPC